MATAVKEGRVSIQELFPTAPAAEQPAPSASTAQPAAGPPQADACATGPAAPPESASSAQADDAPQGDWDWRTSPVRHGKKYARHCIVSMQAELIKRQLEPSGTAAEMHARLRKSEAAPVPAGDVPTPAGNPLPAAPAEDDPFAPHAPALKELEEPAAPAMDEAALKKAAQVAEWQRLQNFFNECQIRAATQPATKPIFEEAKKAASIIGKEVRPNSIDQCQVFESIYLKLQEQAAEKF